MASAFIQNCICLCWSNHGLQYMKLCRPYWFFIALDACSDMPFSACRYRAAAAVGDSARATRGSALPQDGRDGRQDSCTGIVRRFCVRRVPYGKGWLDVAHQTNVLEHSARTRF